MPPKKSKQPIRIEDFEPESTSQVDNEPSTSKAGSKKQKAKSGETKQTVSRTKKAFTIVETEQPIVEEQVNTLLEYFTIEALNFMKSISYMKNKKEILVDEQYIDDNFINIYPLYLNSKDFRTDFINAVKFGIFQTSLFENVKKKEKEEILFYTTKIEGTNNYPCPVCKSKATYISDHQTRSGDEGSEVFLFCLKCGVRYRFH